jgi:hypothetical protein
MRRDEFEQVRDDPCQGCGAPVHLVPNPNNGALSVRCTSATCRRPFTPWGGIPINIKQTTTKRRQEYPMGESLDDVWARFGNTCVVCSAPKDVLNRLGIGRQRQHVLEYAQHGHQGPLVPMCVPCHENATQRQKLFWFWYRRIEADGGGAVSGSGTSVSGNGLSPDPLRATREAPARRVEGLPDDDA